MTDGENSTNRALLLLNLGTPDSPSPTDVRRYLAEFLMDPYVIDIPVPIRFLLVYGAILPTRPKKSAEAYEKIWTARGSPLGYHLEDLARKVRRALETESITVVSAMRYGNPSIQGALEDLVKKGVTEVTVFPLYPQFSLAATRSSLDKVRDVAKKVGFRGQLKSVPAFYAEAGFVRAFVEGVNQALEGFDWDHILFSFHGLPERHVRKTDLTGRTCLSSAECCGEIGDANRDCYRAQSFATAHAIARGLGLQASDFGRRYGISFQSRLGRTPWITPYTDFVIPELAQKGVKRLAVVCPSFVADCLETLEEIGIRGRDSFTQAGGTELHLVPSLNSSESWTRAVCELSKKGELLC